MTIKADLLLGMALTLALYAPASQITSSVNIVTNPNISLCLKRTGVEGSQSQFKADERIDCMFIGPSTKAVYFRMFPSGNFDFHLFDENGKEMPKTKAGLALTSTPPKPTKDDLIFWRTSGFRPIFFGNEGLQGQLFCPNDIFVITNKGAYELEVRIRLCVIMTNGLPDVTAMMDGRNATGLGLPFIKDFGVLTSPPLRVKIVKE